MKRISVAFLLLFSLIGAGSLLGQSTPDATNVTLLTVGKESISSEDFRIRFTFERYIREMQLKQLFDTYTSFGYTSDQVAQQLSNQPPYSTWLNDLQIPDLMGQQVIDDMIDDQLIQQEAKRLKIVITDADVQREIQQFLGVTGDPYKLTTDEKAQYETALKAFLDSLKEANGLGQKEIRPYYEALAYRTVLHDYLANDIGQVLYAHLRHILVATEAEAKDILKQLKAGKDFASLAKQYSLDTGSGQNGGELDWAALDIYVSEFADAVRQAHEGDIVGPVKTQFGYHVIDILGLEKRDGTEADINVIKTTTFDKWLNTLRTKSQSEIKDVHSWLDYVPKLPAYTLPADPVIATSTPRPQPTATIVDINAINFDDLYKDPSKRFSIAIPTGWTVAQSADSPDGGVELTLSNIAAFSVIQVSEHPLKSFKAFKDLDSYFSSTMLDYSWAYYDKYEETDRHQDHGKLIISFDLTTQNQHYLAQQIAWLDHDHLISIQIIVPAAQPKLLDYLVEHLVDSLKLETK